jgi:GTPase SAR1 family protein
VSDEKNIQSGNDTIQAGGDVTQIGQDQISGNKVTYHYYTAPAPDNERERRNRKKMILKVYDFWVKGVLENSLHRAALINLGMAYQPDAVVYPWKMIIEQPNTTPQVLPQGTPIISVFDDLHSEMVILGSPGSGKTTMLLDLARKLILRAQEDERHPIPVVFNLSSWSQKCLPLSVWMVQELNERYDVPRQVGQAWIDKDQILPLLDGLDEVRQEVRTSCVETINTYRQEHGMVGMVVCSRIADYLQLTAKLKLRGAIVLQPLTDEQIDTYLTEAGDQLSAVRTLLHNDSELRVFANTPLMLSIMTLAYQGMPIDSLSEQYSMGARRKSLFDNYVERMLNRRGGDHQYTPEQTRRYLGWIAGRMVEHGQTMFYIEKIQPSWIKQQRQSYALVAGLISGLTFGLTLIIASILCLGVILNISNGIFIGSLFSLIIGVSFGLFSGRESARLEDVRIAEELRFSWKQAIQKTWWRLPIVISGFGLAGMLQEILGGEILGGAIGGLVGGIALGVGAGAILRFDAGLLAGSITGLGAGILNSLIGGPVGGIMGGLGIGLVVSTGVFLISSTIADEIKTRHKPNEGIHRSGLNGSRIGSILGLVFGLGSGLVVILVADTTFGLAVAIGISLSGGLVFCLLSGGTAVVQHFALRLLVAFYNYTPLNCVRFFDHAAERILLYKVGGGYIFVHRMLLEYFASLDVELQDENNRN